MRLPDVGIKAFPLAASRRIDGECSTTGFLGVHSWKDKGYFSRTLLRGYIPGVRLLVKRN